MDATTLLFGIKSMASLLIPTAEFSNVVHYVLRCFSKIYPLVKYKNKVVTIIADHVKFSLKQQFPLWFEKCRKHTCYIGSIRTGGPK
jgi:hypothetical protein